MSTGTAAPQDIDEYIAGFPPEIQAVLQEIRATVRRAAPDAVEAIAYQMPTFRQEGNLVHFAAYKKHIGFYPAPTGLEAFKEDLAGYKGSKGAVQFPLDRPIPYDLIRRITAYRVSENLADAQAKAEAKKAARKKKSAD